ncbi:MAG: hypothetical protein H7A45_15025 [Verrucomicrobiales bacterium]|nr:hypothetical protein [Verrucomicrobiales bacterium]MCP5526122.1 hypothetical protein [Verrucomicrobiales bacterium]
MLKCHELIGFMPSGLAQEIVDYLFANERPAYQVILAAVAEANRVRPVFLQRKPRAKRHADMLNTLSRPRMEEAAATLLREWLLKAEKAMLIEFLNDLGIEHEDGVVEEFPDQIDDAKLAEAVDHLLAKHPPEKVCIYLNTVRSTSGVQWKNLDDLLANDERLQIA